MSKRVYSSLAVEGEAELNAELFGRGIPHTIGDLFHDGDLCPECGPELLDLFRRPLPFNVRTALAGAAFTGTSCLGQLQFRRRWRLVPAARANR